MRWQTLFWIPIDVEETTWRNVTQNKKVTILHIAGYKSVLCNQSFCDDGMLDTCTVQCYGHYHMYLLSAWSIISTTEELNYIWFYLYLNSLMWLVAATVDSEVLSNSGIQSNFHGGRTGVNIPEVFIHKHKSETEKRKNWLEQSKCYTKESSRRKKK